MGALTPLASMTVPTYVLHHNERVLLYSDVSCKRYYYYYYAFRDPQFTEEKTSHDIYRGSIKTQSSARIVEHF